MEAIYRGRSWIASGPSLALFILAALSALQPHRTPEKPKPPIRISLAPPIPEAPPPVPPPAPPQPAPPLTQAPPPPAAIPKPRPVSPKPSPIPAPAPQQTAPIAPSPAPPIEAAAPALPAPPPPAPPAPAHASQDDVYAAMIRQQIEAGKHYPTSKEARMQRPSGTVQIWFLLNRSGALQDAGVESSSGSLILDQAALSLVKISSYPAIPPDAFPGQGSHRFTVKLEYNPAA